MGTLRPSGRRRSLAAALALTLALGGAACGRGKVPAAEYDPDAPAQDTSAPPAAEEPAPAPPPAPGAPLPPPLTPEQDSIQEARAFAQRQRSMESYESCMRKADVVAEEPVRTTLREACARSSGGRH
jgi:hypothetical protein